MKKSSSNYLLFREKVVGENFLIRVMNLLWSTHLSVRCVKPKSIRYYGRKVVQRTFRLFNIISFYVGGIMFSLILFLVTFVVLFLIYLLFVIRRGKYLDKFIKGKEISYLKKVYKIKLKESQVNFKTLSI